MDVAQSAGDGEGDGEEGVEVAGERTVAREPLIERVAAKVLEHEGLEARPREPAANVHDARHAGGHEGLHHLVLVLEVGQVARQRQRLVEHLHPHRSAIFLPLSPLLLHPSRRFGGGDDGSDRPPSGCRGRRWWR